MTSLKLPSNLSDAELTETLLSFDRTKREITMALSKLAEGEKKYRHQLRQVDGLLQVLIAEQNLRAIEGVPTAPEPEPEPSQSVPSKPPSKHCNNCLHLRRSNTSAIQYECRAWTLRERKLGREGFTHYLYYDGKAMRNEAPYCRYYSEFDWEEAVRNLPRDIPEPSFEEIEASTAKSKLSQILEDERLKQDRVDRMLDAKLDELKPLDQLSQ
jgi:hypothetical protein